MLVNIKIHKKTHCNDEIIFNGFIRWKDSLRNLKLFSKDSLQPLDENKRGL